MPEGYRKTKADKARGATFKRHTPKGKLVKPADGWLILQYPLPSLRTAENFAYTQAPTDKAPSPLIPEKLTGDSPVERSALLAADRPRPPAEEVQMTSAILYC